MADRSNDKANSDAEDTDELLYTDLNENSSELRLDHLPLKLDHCDLLLDAIDAQLGQLQVQPQKRQAISTEHDCNDAERSCGSQEASIAHERSKQRLDRRTRNKVEVELHREQVIWRLERLLGDTCKEEGGMTEEIHPHSDSICTEDFVRCFREEMVELPLPEDMQKPDKEKEAQQTEISDSTPVTHTHQSEQKGEIVLSINKKGIATTGESRKKKELEGDTKHCRILVIAAVSTTLNLFIDLRETTKSVPYSVEVATEQENLQHINIRSPKARCLAGVPVWSFDTVSIDSDLDSVCTEQIRQHIRKRPGWLSHSLIESVRDMDDFCTNQSDNETPAQKESEPQCTPVQRFPHGNVRNRGSPVRKAQRSRRETYRLVSSLGDADKDTDEEVNNCRRCRPKRTSEKMQSHWQKMKERLSTLRQKCEKEEATLRLKKTQLTDVELSLFELQQRRQHALQELERLTTETAQMEKEKRTLVSILHESKAEMDSVSVQLQKLQRQRESCLLEVRGMEEELTSLSQHRKTLKDEACMERRSVVMSVLEREEMERQLDSAKTELFSEQRRSREKLESMQEKLEETLEELLRATEAQSSLRNRCSCLEEKLKQKEEQTEALEHQACVLQGELGECKIRVGTLEKMLAQKELQLLDLQEQRRVLQAARDDLRGELQHLKTQHYNALRDARGQAHKMIEAALKQQKKDLTLAQEQQIQKAEEEKATLKKQAQSLTQHIESVQNSLQLKEEEAKMLKMSLEQQKEEAKQCVEKLHLEALEKVHKAIEEERAKWEAEKVEAVQVHCGILEEQNKKNLERTRSEMQREKSKTLGLQHKVVELQREGKRTVLQLEQAVQLAEKETERLQMTLKERESSHNKATAEQEQQLRHWAQELATECEHLHLLVEQKGAKLSTLQLPASPTVAEALTNLKTLRDQLNNLISHLYQKLDSQRQTTELLRKDKERELSIQRKQLRMERDQALDSLKERLIQEHIEELSSLNWAHMCDGGGEGEGVAASLRKQLKAKDLELKQVQRSMGQWKEKTVARLACKFEEELTAELERKASKTQEGRQEKPERSEGETKLSAKEVQDSVCSPLLYVVDPAASHSPSDVASLKLLRYLQSRVKQLRIENQTYTFSPSPLNIGPPDLSGSYLTTVSAFF
ncbi:trichohyalin isoform X4 [Scomber scombrus]|uniref:Trichohyalin isoform X4 n=1 Tax=Scomber scombrus TaxID=13677 RepID=A0AAV1P3T7_SCOSC